MRGVYIDVSITDPFAHAPFRVFPYGEAELFVKPLRVHRHQHHPAKVLQAGVGEYHFHQPLAQAATAPFLQYEYVGEITEGGEVRDHAREAGLLTVFVNPEAERVFDASFHEREGNVFRPVRFPGKVGMYHLCLQ